MVATKYIKKNDRQIGTTFSPKNKPVNFFTLTGVSLAKKRLADTPKTIPFRVPNINYPKSVSRQRQKSPRSQIGVSLKINSIVTSNQMANSSPTATEGLNSDRMIQMLESSIIPNQDIKQKSHTKTALVVQVPQYSITMDSKNV